VHCEIELVGVIVSKGPFVAVPGSDLLDVGRVEPGRAVHIDHPLLRWRSAFGAGSD